MNDSRDHLDEVVDCLRHRPVSTTALQMRQAADEIQRCWREHDEDMERMERATVAIELLSAEAERLQQRIAEMETEAFDHVRKIKAITATNALIDEGWKARDRRIAELGRQNKILELKTSGTLANNLCQDHRDKQTGKPCLACEIERLQKKLAHTPPVGLRQAGWVQEWEPGRFTFWSYKPNRDVVGEPEAVPVFVAASVTTGQ